jgi:hypothetical protein
MVWGKWLLPFGMVFCNEVIMTSIRILSGGQIEALTLPEYIYFIRAYLMSYFIGFI